MSQGTDAQGGVVLVRVTGLCEILVKRFITALREMTWLFLVYR